MSTFRRVGRPPLAPGEGSADVHLTVPESLYDRLYAAASRERVTVPELIRQVITRDLETQTRLTVD